MVSYTQLLKEELSKRCQRNQDYSLRAFARDLEMTPAQLSRVLNGKRHMSWEVANKVAQLAFKTKKERQVFSHSFQWETAKDSHLKEQALKKLSLLMKSNDSAQITLDEFALIAQWYHIPLLHYLELYADSFSCKQAATFLGIKEIEVKLGMERLERLGALANGRPTGKSLSPQSEIPNQHLKSFHRQMINKALIAIDKQSIDNRSISAKTMTLDKKLLPEMKEAIQEFKQKISHIREHSTTEDSIYQLNIQLFELGENS